MDWGLEARHDVPGDPTVCLLHNDLSDISLICFCNVIHEKIVFQGQ
jgi:hypothetical protein